MPAPSLELLGRHEGIARGRKPRGARLRRAGVAPRVHLRRAVTSTRGDAVESGTARPGQVPAKTPRRPSGEGSNGNDAGMPGLPGFDPPAAVPASPGPLACANTQSDGSRSTAPVRRLPRLLGRVQRDSRPGCMHGGRGPPAPHRPSPGFLPQQDVASAAQRGGSAVYGRRPRGPDSTRGRPPPFCALCIRHDNSHEAIFLPTTGAPGRQVAEGEAREREEAPLLTLCHAAEPCGSRSAATPTEAGGDFTGAALWTSPCDC